MLYGSETWALKVDSEKYIQRTDMRMLRWINGVKWSDRITNEEVLRRFGLEDVINDFKKEMRWFEHVERMSEANWVRRSMHFEVEGERVRGRPKKGWMESIKYDMKVVGLRRDDAQDRNRWRRGIHKQSDLSGND